MCVCVRMYVCCLCVPVDKMIAMGTATDRTRAGAKSHGNVEENAE